MDTTTLVLVAVAVALLAIAFWCGSDLPGAGFLAAGRTLRRNLPILLLGFLIAGLVQVIIPKDLVTRWLGTEAGLKGILIGCLAGGPVPGAPYAVFPLVAALYQTGAGLGAVVSFALACGDGTDRSRTGPHSLRCDVSGAARRRAAGRSRKHQIYELIAHDLTDGVFIIRRLYVRYTDS